ncbi:MAG: TetR/AcrR family transcriptional regulator [Planctomycetaceae bacterium]|nr:TetR/AcrR family transcriptional regulator [Planctomycetaceae bacterium]
MRKRLAEAAYILFSENPIADVTLDMVAEKAAVTKGSIYCHYKSKKELILEACQVYYQRWERLVVDYANVDHDAISRLRKAILSASEMCLFDDRNRFFTAQVFALAIKDADVRESWAAFYRRVHAFYQSCIEAIAASGAAIITNPKATTDRILAILEGVKQQAFFDATIGAASQIGLVVESAMKTALES